MNEMWRFIHNTTYLNIELTIYAAWLHKKNEIKVVFFSQYSFTRLFINNAFDLYNFDGLISNKHGLKLYV